MVDGVAGPPASTLEGSMLAGPTSEVNGRKLVHQIRERLLVAGAGSLHEVSVHRAHLEAAPLDPRVYQA
jgi:hypothetical protein